MVTKKISDSDRTRLLDTAREALPRAYAPYSGVKVGASVLTKTGQVYSSGNVENASYGLSLCAERAAIAVAVAAEGAEMHIRALAVVSDQDGPFAPCGACRQVIYEFGPEALVIFQGEDGLAQASIAELLPQAFILR